ncbi:MAG: hypothetical protein HUU31_26365, partial [Anaerolineae bacterium]|nr:hypothetical protein [Anaerolineae bacterium]
ASTLSIWVQVSVSSNASLNFGFEGAVARRVDNTGANTNTWHGPYTSSSPGDVSNLTCWLQHNNSNTTIIEKMRISTDGAICGP